MKLEKTFHDEIEQFLKLGWDIKVIPWTAGESSRSKIYVIFIRMPFYFRIEHQSTLRRKEVIHWLLNFWLTNSRFDNSWLYNAYLLLNY